MTRAKQEKDNNNLEHLQEIVSIEHNGWEASGHKISAIDLSPWENFARTAQNLTGKQRDSFLQMIASRFGNDMVQRTLRVLQSQGETAGQQNNHR